MYKLSKPNCRIMSKARRGITQKVDSLEIPNSCSKDSKSLTTDFVTADMSSPKPIFYQVNGKRSHVQKNSHEITPQHEEIIKYVQESWRSIYKEYESTKHSTNSGVPSVVYYQDNSTNQHLINFKPFDLEMFWGERLLRNIQQSI